MEGATQCPETGQGGRAKASLTVADAAVWRAAFSFVASGKPPNSASLGVLGVKQVSGSVSCSARPAELRGFSRDIVSVL